MPSRPLRFAARATLAAPALACAAVAALAACGGSEPLGAELESGGAVLGAISVDSFTLIDTRTGAPVPGHEAVKSDVTLNRATLPSSVAIRANTTPSWVGSVVFGWDANATQQIESFPPYSIAGDANGQLNPFSLALGTHTLVATPYSESRGAGTAGSQLRVALRVVDSVSGPAVVRAVLVNADTDQDISALTEGMTIDLGRIGTPRLSVRAETDPAIVGSVRFELNGALVRHENLPPYAIGGDGDGGRDYLPWSPGAGSYTLSLTAFTGSNGSGTAGAARTVRFTVAAGTSGGAVTTYYVSSSGDDGRDGRSISTAWRTISKVSQTALQPGSEPGAEVRVLFEGGRTFSGNLVLDSGDRGPITIGSYGSGRAVLSAGNGHGVRVTDLGAVTIKDLVIRGAGSTNRGNGIFAHTSGRSLGYVKIDSVDISGFFAGVDSTGRIQGHNGYGIAVGAWNNGRYTEIDIRDSYVHGNGTTGIATESTYPTKTIGKVTVAYNRVDDTSGIPGVLANHTGSGIVIGGALSGVIERNTAKHNGYLCERVHGGPVGIWAWNSTNFVIQHNESSFNTTANGADGGGFDFDGSVSNSVMQYNYSHDNGGAGYLMAEFGTTAGTHKNNVVRYNISHNDGLKSSTGQGGIHFWANNGASITDLDVYNNLIINSKNGAVTYSSGTFSNIVFRNNLFAVGPRGTATVPVLKFKSGSGNLFQGNSYYAYNQSFRIVDSGTTYSSLDAWAAAKGQERIGGAAIDLTGKTSVPALEGFADGASLFTRAAAALADIDDFSPLSAYRPRAGSPLVNRGLNVIQLGETVAEDILGVSLDASTAFDIGVAEKP